MHIEVDILRRQVTYQVHNAGCFIRLNRVTYPGYVVLRFAERVRLMVYY